MSMFVPCPAAWTLKLGSSAVSNSFPELVLNQSRLFNRGEHLLTIGLEFQFPSQGPGFLGNGIREFREWHEFHIEISRKNCPPALIRLV